MNAMNQVAQNLRLSIKMAFRTLRAQGVSTWPGYMCCGGCAGCGIDNKRKAGKIGARFHAYAYYHQQDAEDIENGQCNIRYGSFDGDARVIGQLVAGAMARQGLRVDWDGDPDVTILVEQ